MGKIMILTKDKKGRYCVCNTDKWLLKWIDKSDVVAKASVELLSLINVFDTMFENVKSAFKKVAVYIDRNNSYVGVITVRKSDAIPKLNKIVWYSFEDIEELDVKPINYTKDFKYLADTTDEINSNTVGIKIDKSKLLELTKITKDDTTDKKDIPKKTNGVVLDMADEEVDNPIKDSTENKDCNNTPSIELSDTEIISDKKEDTNKEDKTVKSLQDCSENDLYINILKLLLKGNKISIPAKVFNRLKKGPVFPIFVNHNNGNIVVIQDIYLDEQIEYKKITACISISSTKYADVEILKEFDSEELPIGFNSDFKRDYLKWYKDNLHVKI